MKIPFALILKLASVLWCVQGQAFAEQRIIIPVDQSKLIHLKAPAGEFILGNPSIADVTTLHPGVLVVTGKTEGHTNLIVRDQQGETELDTYLSVTEQDGSVMRVLMGTGVSLYSCSPNCDQIGVPKGKDKKKGGGPCEAHDQTASDGSKCGNRSAYDRPGGGPGLASPP